MKPTQKRTRTHTHTHSHHRKIFHITQLVSEFLFFLKLRYLAILYIHHEFVYHSLQSIDHDLWVIWEL
jgi:hypothetical protein